MTVLAPSSVVKALKTTYHQKVRERFGESMFRETKLSKNFITSTNYDIGKVHTETAESRRSSNYY